MRIPICEICHKAEPVVWWLADTEEAEEDYVLCLGCWCWIEAQRPGVDADVVTYTEAMK